MSTLALRKKKSSKAARRGPKPGTRVRGSRTGRPLMALLDLLGQRWALRIMWELRDDALGFRELQLRCDRISPSVLSQRLRDLGAAGVLEADGGGYRLTPDGRALLDMLAPLQGWAERWARRAAGAG